MKTDYRSIWEVNHGPIPVDKDGRSYEIHHIDGNRKNNKLDNLLCLSIQEHYDLHKRQEDFAACGLIANRMELTVEELKLINERKGDKIRGTKKGPYTEEHRRKISEALKGRKAGPRPEEVKKRISETLKGHPGAWTGKKRSEETKRKIAETMKNRKNKVARLD